MAKWNDDAAGNSCHIHQSLQDLDGAPLFHDPGAEHGMSETMRHYLAGLLRHASEITFFLAPYINSYKRFVAGTFAPTKAIWSLDNRTAGYRICGAGSKAVRVECRVGGADLNPYLAMAALLAAGIDGMEEKLELEAEFKGDAYGAKKTRSIPQTLLERHRRLAQIQDASSRLRRRGDRPLRARGQMGTGRIRSPRHRLRSRARFREGLNAITICIPVVLTNRIVP